MGKKWREIDSVGRLFWCNNTKQKCHVDSDTPHSSASCSLVVKKSPEAERYMTFIADLSNRLPKQLYGNSVPFLKRNNIGRDAPYTNGRKSEVFILEMST